MGQKSLPSLLAALSQSINWANRYAGLLFFAGLMGVIFKQWRLWQADKKRLAEIQPPKPRPALEDWPCLPQVSALVAAWNEADHIQAHIKSFRALRYPHKQLVLVVGGSDGTFELASRLAGPGVQVMEQNPGEGKQAALRRGLERINGEIVYLTDADCCLDDESFEQVIYPISAGLELAVSGRFAPLVEQRCQPFVQMQWCIDNYGRSRAGNYIQGLIGRNAAVKRNLLAETGDFSYSAKIGTDYLLACQILAVGKQIRYCHNSVVATEFHSEFGGYKRQQTRWLRNILIHGIDFGVQDQVLGVFCQMISGFIFIILTGLSLLFNGLLLVSWALLIVFAWLSRVRYLWFGVHSLNVQIDRRTYILSLYYFLLDQCMLLSALFSWFDGRHRLRW